MDIKMESIPRVSKNVKVRNEEFGLLLVSKRTPILALNEDSMMIWNCLDGKSSVEDIIKEVNSQIDGELEQTTEIVKCFVESCCDLGLIEI